MQAFGWRAVFWILGAVGLVWVALWRWCYHDDPARQPGITPAELAEIPGVSAAGGHSAFPWGQLLRARQLWLIMLMYAFYGWGSYFCLSWLHTYLVMGRGFSETEMGLLSTLPFILGVGANGLGGFLSDWLCRKYGRKFGRRLMGSTSLTASAALVLAAAMTRGKMAGLVLISMGYGAMDLMLPSAWAICLDVGGPYAGAVSGAMNSAGHIGGFSISVLFGYIVENYGNYDAPLYVIAAALLVSAVIFSRIDPTQLLIPPKEDTCD